jgi:hypothetical protein
VLALRAADRGVNIPLSVNRRISDRMEVFGQTGSDYKGQGITGVRMLLNLDGLGCRLGGNGGQKERCRGEQWARRLGAKDHLARF